MRSKRLIVISALIIVAIVVLTVFRSNGNRLSAEPDNIILISIDTIRADHLSCYGYRHKTTPNIDAFADGAVLFENCFSNVPMTLPSHASMMTGVIPPTHGVHDNLMVLSDSAVTLPEILQTEGYTTYGIISAEVLNQKYGINQGFDVYDDKFDNEIEEAVTVAERTGDETVTHALKWLDENYAKKKFMFVHFFDPHSYYRPPPPYDKLFRYAYDGEIAFADHCVGQLIDKLKSLGQYDNSLIIITGDHAELLGEHDEIGHSYFIYQNVLRVPLIVKPAGHSKPARITDNTSLTDIMPTVLGQIGIEIPVSVQGIDLSDYFVLKKHTISDRFIFNESLTATKYGGNGLLGIINDQWHYIQTTRPELYNRIEDPRQVNDLISQKPKLARILRDQLSQVLDSASRNSQAAATISSDESIKALESLGYVRGAVDTDVTFDQKREDPKDLLNIHNAFQKVLGFVDVGKFDEAIELCDRIIDRRPDIIAGYDMLAQIYEDLKLYDENIELMQKKLALLPDDIGILKYLAETCTLAEDYPQAVGYMKIILKLEPDNIEAYSKLIDIYIETESYDEAIALVEQRLTLSPENVGILKLLARLYNMAQNYPQTIDTLNTLVKLEPDLARTYLRLAKNYLLINDPRNALQNYLKALQLEPENLPARIGAADIYNKTGKLKQAVEHYEIALKQNPNLAVKHNTVAWIQATSLDPELYDPRSALIHAQKAVELSKNKLSPAHGYQPYFLDTLAAAQSANGQFEAAIETAGLAIKLSRQKGLNAVADDIQTRLNLYKQHKTDRQ